MHFTTKQNSFKKSKTSLGGGVCMCVCVCVCVCVSRSVVSDSLGPQVGRCCVYVFPCLLRWHHRYAYTSKLFKLHTLNMFHYLYVKYSSRNLGTKRKAKSLRISKSNINFLPCLPTHSNYTVFPLCFLFLQL